MKRSNTYHKTLGVILLILGMSLALSGCDQKKEPPKTKPKPATQESSVTSIPEEKNADTDAQPEPPATPVSKDTTIVIDPGHTAIVADKQEPIGPGASELKAGDTSGTSGVRTGINEYEFTLALSMQLKRELEGRGYTVVMTRDSNDVSRSCVERADIMNNAGAKACVRIHANGSENAAARGAMTICTPPDSPYVPDLYTSSRNLADCVLSQYIASTGAVSEGVWETDTMSGNNWSKIPVTIIETGYMSNPEEDLLLSSPEYQAKMVQGIANGLELYCNPQ